MKPIRKRLAIVLGGILIPVIITFGVLHLYYTEDRINRLAINIERKIPGRVELILNQTIKEIYAGSKGRREYFDSLLLSNVQIFEDLMQVSPENISNVLIVLKNQFLNFLPDSFYNNIELSVIDSNGVVVYSTKKEFLNLDLKEFGTLWDSVRSLIKGATYFIPVSFSSRDAKMRTYLYTRINSKYYLDLSLDVNPTVYKASIERLRKLSVFMKDIGIYNVGKKPILEYFPPYPERTFRSHPFYRDLEETMYFYVGSTKLAGLLFVRLDFYPLFSVFLFNLLVYAILITTLSVVARYFEKLVIEESSTLTNLTEMVKNLEDPKKIEKKIYTEEVFDLIRVLHTYVVRTKEKIKENEVLLKKFRGAFYNFSEKLAILAERFDPEDAGHLKRVRYLTKLILDNMEIEEDYKNSIVEFSILHDIGKIFIPASLLNKSGPLTEEERELVRKHTIYAEKLLSHPELKIAREIAVYHHENYDGTGYPFGLKGDEIPFPARVVKVVNTYDVLRSDRPYKKGLSHEEALKILLVGDKKTRPSHFDPKIFSIFLKISSKGDPYEGLEEL
jgi:HD-GYP domain-containing protein (c-di-GMP phosphodiesterase class II)